MRRRGVRDAARLHGVRLDRRADACGPTGGAGPIIAFELARTPQAVAALFGSEPCTARFVAAQRSAQWLDSLVFIPAYAAFLMLAGMALRSNGRRIAIAAIAAALIAGLCDEIEGATMFAIMDPLPGAAWLFVPLFWAAHVKFALLGLAELLLGGLLAKGRWPGKIASAIVFAGGLGSLAYLLIAAHDPLMMRRTAVPGSRCSWRRSSARSARLW